VCGVRPAVPAGTRTGTKTVAVSGLPERPRAVAECFLEHHPERATSRRLLDLDTRKLVCKIADMRDDADKTTVASELMNRFSATQHGYRRQQVLQRTGRRAGTFVRFAEASVGSAGPWPASVLRESTIL
jgi:hypothetical protein